jgi:anaerobic ribonucleoside-triphosphate reductase activating protein
MQIRLAGIVPESIVDGPGYRFAIFAQGCPHKCPGCHNPHTHDFGGGTLHTVEAVIERIKSFPNTDGVTFTGGEPFCQPEAFMEIALAFPAHNIYCFTGFTFEELLQNQNPITPQLLACIDVLVDGKYIDEQRDYRLKFKGSRNQRIIDCKESTKQRKVVLLEENS